MGTRKKPTMRPTNPPRPYVSACPTRDRSRGATLLVPERLEPLRDLALLVVRVDRAILDVAFGGGKRNQLCGGHEPRKDGAVERRLSVDPEHREHRGREV